MIGARLRALRRLCGMNQRSLADAVLVSPSAIGMYEQGRREPSLDRLVALAQVFGVSTDFLLTGVIRTSRDAAAAEHFAALHGDGRVGERTESKRQPAEKGDTVQKTQKTVDRSASHAL